ncbi:ATP-binding cassette domain-containing protein [Amycolatopsis nigrescens]|uniref:ATP-binding cassette domain-containing protein n=1 Tax=Amycolatopsis nigrescens TaxID=381445 RepID=UPI00036E2386|nr:excinuclease ABC subunit UvrA [Amycolatopsis nigrescens]
MTPLDSIVLKGAHEHNLKNVSLRIPKDRLTVFTGVSGSGKSSIVFGTIAVESQRQLNETFSWFIRNRLPKYEAPRAESIENLSTAVVVDQKPVGGNSRSTVGTMTEIHSILRVLFSRHGKPVAGPSTVYSFNHPQGMCGECEGLGRTVRLDLAKLLHEDRSLNEGAIDFPSFAVGTFQWQLYAESGLFDPDKPLREFTAEERELLLHGGGFKVDRRGRNGIYKNEYEGVVTRFTRRYLKRELFDALGEKERRAAERVVHQGPCPVCHGARLNQAALRSKIGGRTIADYSAMEVGELIPELERIDDEVAKPVAEAALAALRRIEDVGLSYLSLDRETSTLSGGEGQRLKTVRHLGSSLTGLTYIFDEPSVGLHPRDVHRLNELLLALRDKGNTVLVVEHDRDVIGIADRVVDLGPGAGGHGGEVVFEGTVAGLRESDTLTGQRLRQVPALKGDYRTPTGALPIRDADLHNLKNVSLDIPTGVLTAVTGVAGSGKSTLISNVFTQQHPGATVVDQSAIGTSSRSTPATYTDIMDTVRKLFASANGVDAGLFSFNSAGGCPECGGHGVLRTDLAYLDPVTTTCELCHGRRFREEVLAYRLDGKSIVDVLALTVEEALGYFTERSVLRKLSTLDEVGLGYLTLGQPLSTLSGGERQRIKLAHRLGETAGIYVFDEPTTGLHMADIDVLLALLDRLVDGGNTVLVVEHDLDVVKHADWVIDLGPEAGRDGGQVVFQGTPSDLLHATGSHTATHLRASLPG